MVLRDLFIFSVLLSVAAAFWSSEKSKKSSIEVNSQAEILFSDEPNSPHIISASQIPASGFISSTIVGKDGFGISFMMKTVQRVDRLSYPCSTIEFINLPNPNPSPFVGGATFTIDKDLYHNKFAWTNGKEFLSFIANDDGGNWIVGPKPGYDSGYVFYKPLGETIVPLSNDDDVGTWHWLSNSQWVVQPQVKLICKDQEFVDGLKNPQAFYKIEYFDVETQAPYISNLIPYPFSFTGKNVSEETVAMYFNVRHSKWIPLKNLKVIAVMGEPNVITSNGISSIGHLVNEEHGGRESWRLTFRYGPGYGSVDKKEASIIYSRHGSQDAGIDIKMLTPQQLSFYQQRMYSELSKVKIGEYIWLWFSVDSTQASNQAISDISVGMHTERHDEILLECLYVHDNKAVFTYFSSERIKTMRQTALNRDTRLVVMTKHNNGSVSFSLDDVELKIRGGYNLGSDLVGVVKQYLTEKEGVLGGMSSCYLYHAAVSMPRALVYAAEMICVLIGSKPLTMIQYVTPTDHQWKFPLVSKLTKGIKAASLIHPNLELNFTVTTLGEDKTLIIYRSNRKYLVDALRPIGAAQALHPGPYPDPTNLKGSLKEQIYNAWWNGFVLGYPPSFIDSYCLTFHNDLTTAEKQEQVDRAKVEVQEYFNVRGLQPIKIGAGLDKPLDKVWNFF